MVFFSDKDEKSFGEEAAVRPKKRPTTRATTVGTQV
jgi:hypothetical protein